MKIHYLFNSNERKLHLPEGTKVCSHQLQSTEGDNLIEYAGRKCYDSLGQEKSRNSSDYHKHINEVGHTSVQEHFWGTFSVPIPASTTQILSCIALSAGRKGLAIYPDVENNRIILSMNARSANEIKSVRSFIQPILPPGESHPFEIFAEKLKDLCPLALSNFNLSNDLLDLKNDNLITECQFNNPKDYSHNVFISYVIEGVSRGLTHELIRHRDISPSQRSTRYVDESDSDWAWHPLINQMDETHQNALHEWEQDSKVLYAQTVNLIQDDLIKKGVDKFTARKQARGAARGILGNALSTEGVFTASLSTWRNVFIKQRMVEGADLEICQLANLIYQDLLGKNLIDAYEVKPHSFYPNLYVIA